MTRKWRASGLFNQCYLAPILSQKKREEKYANEVNSITMPKNRVEKLLDD